MDSPIRWTDPTTRQTFLVDPRTGNSRREAFSRPTRVVLCEEGDDTDCSGACECESKKVERVTLVDRSRLRKRARVEEKEQSDEDCVGEEEIVPDWMLKTLQVSFFRTRQNRKVLIDLISLYLRIGRIQFLTFQIL